MPWAPIPPYCPTGEEIAFRDRAEAMLQAQRDAQERSRLRDQFAAAALTGVCLFQRDDEQARTSGDIARWAYGLADAMLNERDK